MTPPNHEGNQMTELNGSDWPGIAEASVAIGTVFVSGVLAIFGAGRVTQKFQGAIDGINTQMTAMALEMKDHRTESKKRADDLHTEVTGIATRVGKVEIDMARHQGRQEGREDARAEWSGDDRRGKGHSR